MKMNRFIVSSQFDLIKIPGVERLKSLALESFQEIDPNKTKISEADLFGTTLPDIEYKGTVLKSIRLRYTKKVKYITLVRFLTGKICFDPERVQRIDILLIYDSMLVLQDLVEKDENFKVKFGSDLESLAKILKSFKLHPKTKILDVKKLGNQIEKEIPNFVLPKRNLSTIWKFVEKMYFFSPSTTTGVELKRLPPKQYIGKGYTDKGTARNPALDGSPSWQEVGQTLAFDPEEPIDETKRDKNR